MFVNDRVKKRIHLIIAFAVLFGFGVGKSWGQDFNAAVFYGANPPWDELQAFNVVIVEPEHGFNPEAYRTQNSELFAYVSLGEVLPSRVYAKHIPEEWIIGENTVWESWIVDQTQDGWVDFVLTNMVIHFGVRGIGDFFSIRWIPINWFNEMRSFNINNNMASST